MLWIVSPTKTMKQDGVLKPQSIPCFHKQSEELLETLKTLTKEEIMQLMKVNETIAQKNVERYQAIRFDLNGKCAIESYDGLQFKYMHFDHLNDESKQFLSDHVRILSGFYGVVAPMDSIYPYRLEMQAKLAIKNSKNLYQYWGSLLQDKLQAIVATHQDQHIINLASKEYEKAVQKESDDRNFIDIIFLVEKQGKRKSEATAAKMARGEMIHFIASNQIDHVEGIKQFSALDFQFDEAASNAHTFVFYKVVE